MIEIMAVFLISALAGFFCISFARLSLHGHWHSRAVHKCGNHEMLHIGGKPCEGCGVTDDKWRIATMRATWPFGWEEKT